MIVTNATKEDLRKALDAVNKKYNDNIQFFGDNGYYESDGLEQVGKTRISFRLETKSYTHGGGYRRTFTGKRHRSACWHVHGDFFDALLDLNDKAVIRWAGLKIHQDQHGHGRFGNWQDWNIGSLAQPLYASQACDC